MKKYNLIYIAILAFSILPSLVGAQENNPPILQGPYLGQDPPEITPEIFAPGIMSVDENFEHSAAVFSPDGKEVFWCTNVGWYGERRQQGSLRLYFMKIIDGKWTAPQLAPFVKGQRVERPVFSPDGNRLYMEFSVDQANSDNIDIFFVERKGEEWSGPKPVSPLINSPAWERLHCIAADGSLYFSRNPGTPNEAMYVSRLVNGEFTQPEKLGKDYDSDASEFALVFGPNADYMLTATNNAQHGSDLCVSYRKAEGIWTERIKTPYECGGFLALSPDGKYLFMLNEGIIWVSTSFVEDMRPK
ncbi:MAG: hypothetical protein ABIJ45_02460 [Candidatus Zixiibacteriota bacterium]